MIQPTEVKKFDLLDTCIGLFGVFAGVFYLEFQDMGLYWQLYSIPLVIATLRKKIIFLNELDFILILISLVMLIYFILTNNRFYINISTGTLISILISKLDINYKYIFKLLIILIIINIIIISLNAILIGDSRLLSEDYWILYTFLFDNINIKYQVNNSAFFLLMTYLYFYIQRKPVRWIIAFAIILHTSRIVLLPILILEVIKKNNRIKALLLACVFILFLILFFGFEYIDYYFLKFDESGSDRLERLINYTSSAIFENWLFMPKLEAEYALHNWAVEILYYSGIFGIIYLTSLIFYSNNKIILVLFILAASGPKTCQDLLLYYIMIGYFLSNNNLKNIKILKFNLS